MASEREYLDFILEQLSGLEGITFKKMMGEYILYLNGRIFGGIYDDRFLVKPTRSAVAMMPDADRELPYEGAKEMLLVDNETEEKSLKRVQTACARRGRRIFFEKGLTSISGADIIKSRYIERRYIGRRWRCLICQVRLP